jgi:hypothetical protein
MAWPVALATTYFCPISASRLFHHPREALSPPSASLLSYMVTHMLCCQFHVHLRMAAVVAVCCACVVSGRKSSRLSFSHFIMTWNPIDISKFRFSCYFHRNNPKFVVVEHNIRRSLSSEVHGVLRMTCRRPVARNQRGKQRLRKKTVQGTDDAK